MKAERKEGRDQSDNSLIRCVITGKMKAMKERKNLRSNRPGPGEKAVAQGKLSDKVMLMVRKRYVDDRVGEIFSRLRK